MPHFDINYIISKQGKESKGNRKKILFRRYIAINNPNFIYSIHHILLSNKLYKLDQLDGEK